MLTDDQGWALLREAWKDCPPLDHRNPSPYYLRALRAGAAWQREEDARIVAAEQEGRQRNDWDDGRRAGIEAALTAIRRAGEP